MTAPSDAVCHSDMNETTGKNIDRFGFNNTFGTIRLYRAVTYYSLVNR